MKSFVTPKKLLKEGGMLDNRGETVNGNTVPPGSLRNEVADDIEARLSEGEFVISADVVRFIGLERLMKMRDEAKKGLERMAEIGQMGNAEEVGEESNSTYEDEGFESEIDDILEEIDAEEKGDAGEQTEKMMARGGYIGSGTDLTKAPKNPVFDVRYYKNDKTNAVMYITHINGKPMTPVPEGFKVVTQEEAQKVGLAAEEAKKAAEKPAAGAGAGAVTGQEGPGMPSMTPAQMAQMDLDIASGKQEQTMQQLNQTLTNLAGKSTPVALTKGLANLLSPLTASLSGGPLDPNEALMQESQDVNPSSPAAVGGPAAAAAAQSAATAAMNAGHGNAASIAAANAAATAINNGATPAEAAQAGQNAAISTDTGGSSLGVDALGGSTGDVGVTGSGDSGGIGGIGDVSEGSGGASPWAKGGLVNRRQYPAKKKRGKGIIAQK